MAVRNQIDLRPSKSSGSQEMIEVPTVNWNELDCFAGLKNFLYLSLQPNGEILPDSDTSPLHYEQIRIQYVCQQANSGSKPLLLNSDSLYRCWIAVRK